jgi:hypothetical protein
LPVDAASVRLVSEFWQNLGTWIVSKIFCFPTPTPSATKSGSLNGNWRKQKRF